MAEKTVLEYQVEELKVLNKELALKVSALELWRERMEVTLKEKSTDSNVTPTRDWVKIIIYLVTLALGLLSLATGGAIKLPG